MLLHLNRPLLRWPASLPREFTHRAPLVNLPPARRLWSGRDHSGLFARGSWSQLIYSNKADYNAVSNVTTETSLLTMTSNQDQPLLEGGFFRDGERRLVRIEAMGVLSTTGTPTILFQVRLGTTSGPTYLSGTSVGQTATITTASGASSSVWKLQMDLTCYAAGVGTGNTSLSGSGFVHSPAGFAAPYAYALAPSNSTFSTWTSAIDAALTQYINLSVTWGTAHASNTITMKHLKVWAMN